MKKIKYKNISFFVIFVIFATNFLGCTIMKGGKLETNSHFVFPNSNVEPLGKVSAETSRTSFFVAKIVDKEMWDETISKALKQKGGDVLINYKTTTEVTQIPLYIIYIYITDFRIEGTACKMTVGRKELK